MMQHDFRSLGSWVRRVAPLVLFAGLVAAVPAQAQVTSDSVLAKFMLGPIERSGGGWTIGGGTQPASARTWAAIGSGGSAKIAAQEAIAIAARGGPLAVTAVQKVALGDAAAAVARCMVGGGPLICAGVTAAAGIAYAAYRIKNPADVPGSIVGTGLVDFDPGKDPYRQATDVTMYSTRTRSSNNASATGFIYTSREAAAAGGYATFVAVGCGAGCTADGYELNGPAAPVGPTGWTAYYRLYGSRYVWGTGGFLSQVQHQEGPLQCAASIDALDPAYNVPAGAPVGLDGKCPTARYQHQGLTAEEAATKVVASPPASLAEMVEAVRVAVDEAGEKIAAKLETSGPATQTGNPVSTSTTTGTGTTTTTTVPSYAYTYAGDTITYNTTTTTYTCAGVGACSAATADTTTTTEEEQPKPQDPEDPCTANPDRLGCLKLGDAPTDAPAKATVNLSYAAESVGGLPSGCPADTIVAGHAVSWQPTCDAATNARPWILIGAAFSSLMLVLAALRSM